MHRATVAPTLPAPPTTVTLRFITVSLRVYASPNVGLDPVVCGLQPDARRLKACCCSPKPVARSLLLELHVADDRVCELRGLELRGALHQTCEVVGDLFGADGLIHP